MNSWIRCRRITYRFTYFLSYSWLKPWTCFSFQRPRKVMFGFYIFVTEIKKLGLLGSPNNRVYASFSMGFLYHVQALYYYFFNSVACCCQCCGGGKLREQVFCSQWKPSQRYNVRKLTLFVDCPLLWLHLQGFMKLWDCGFHQPFFIEVFSLFSMFKMYWNTNFWIF